jgi:hypothetical protein
MSLYRLSVLAGLVTLLLSMAGAADAVPITLNVDPTQSSMQVSVTLTALGASQTQTVGVTGPLYADLTLGASPSLSISSAALSIGDSVITFNLGGLGTVTIESTGLVADLFGGPSAGTETTPGLIQVPMSGYTQVLDQGTVYTHATGFAALLVAPTTQDLSVDPISMALDPSTALLAYTVSPGGVLDVVLTSPVSGTTTVTASGQTAVLSLSGSMRFTGSTVLASASVPEPEPLVLLGAGLLGLAAFGRRRSAA